MIGYCLHEQELYGLDFINSALKSNLLEKLKQLQGSQRIDSHKELLQWVLKKWSKLSGEEAGEVKDPHDDELESETEEKRKKAEMIKARKEAMMAKMKAMQKNFAKENIQLLDETPSGLEGKRRLESTSSNCGEGQGSCPSCPGTQEVGQSGGGGPVSPAFSARRMSDLTPDGQALVMTAYIQKSTVLNRKTYHEACDPLSYQYTSFPILPADLGHVPYTSSCGHVMHSSCWSSASKDNKSEFTCPLCRCPGNALIPLTNQYATLQPNTNIPTKLDFNSWVQGLLGAVKYKRELVEAEVSPPQDNEPMNPEDQDDDTAAMETPDLESQKGSSQDSGAKRKRYYTCPVDQVALELDQKAMDSKAFTTLFGQHNEHPLVFSTSVLEMINNFADVVMNTASLGTSEIIPNDERIPLMIWQNMGFTVHAVVAAIRDSGRNIFGENSRSSRQNECLTMLTRLAGVVGNTFNKVHVIRSQCLKLLSTVLEVDTANLSILEVDAFGLLVNITFSLPNLFNEDMLAMLPSGNVQDQHVMHLIYVLHLVQIMLTTDQFSILSEEDMEEEVRAGKVTSDQALPVLDMLQLVRSSVGFAGESDGTEGLDALGVWRDIRDASLPFLRCCGLFYHFLTNTPEPDLGLADPDTEYAALTKYLGLPSSPSKLLESPHLTDLARKWANHPHVHIMLSQASKSTPISYPPRPNTLMKLPEDYSDLINTVSTFTCPKSMTRVPTMCLICGTILCSQSFCCQAILDGQEVGACTMHAAQCGAGTGIFLRVKECKLVLLSGRTKGCFYSPPYVDEFGETDFGLKRGNPLRLCKERMKKIHKMWLNHGIPEEISHAAGRNTIYITGAWEL